MFYRIIVWLVSSLTGLDLTMQENMLLFLCTETTEHKPIKLEASYTVILPPMVSVLCPYPITSKVEKYITL